MKLCIGNKMVEMEWISLIEEGMWYSMEPAILKVKKIHRVDYNNLLRSKKLHPGHYRFNIDVYKVKGDFPIDSEIELGLFDVEIIMNSNKVVKRHKNGYLDIILNVSISDQCEKDKSQLRDILLESLIYS
jgi:hypothetical protein